MATKAELEAEIAKQAAHIQRLQAALDKLGKRALVRVLLPFAPHGLTKSQAPYVKGSAFDEPHRYQALVMEPLVELLRKHGCEDPAGRFTTPVAGEISLCDQGFSRGDVPILIDKATALILAEMIDGISEFARECYTKGHTAGSNLLGRLVEGEITADMFEDSRQQEIARTRQNENATHQAHLERSIQRINSARK